MVRLMGPGLFGAAMFVFWVWAVLDVIATDAMLMRNLEKTTWLFLVLMFPGVGAVAWVALGRPVNAGWRPGDTETRQPRQAGPQGQSRGRSEWVAPEDRDDWGSR